MKNVTVTLDPEVARWARIQAAEQETSVSRFLGEILRRQMADQAGYEASMQHYLAGEPTALRGSGEPYPTRDELHER